MDSGGFAFLPFLYFFSFIFSNDDICCPFLQQRMAPDLRRKVDAARAARLAREEEMKRQVTAQVSHTPPLHSTDLLPLLRPLSRSAVASPKRESHFFVLLPIIPPTGHSIHVTKTIHHRTLYSPFLSFLCRPRPRRILIQMMPSPSGLMLRVQNSTACCDAILLSSL